MLDLGGGRRCAYAKAVEPPGRVRLIAVDISPEELAANTDVTETCVADVAADIPLPDASADVILSCTLLEHVTASRQLLGTWLGFSVLVASLCTWSPAATLYSERRRDCFHSDPYFVFSMP